jgi:RND family efflux transporter MFP subunit
MSRWTVSVFRVRPGSVPGRRSRDQAWAHLPAVAGLLAAEILLSPIVAGQSPAPPTPPAPPVVVARAQAIDLHSGQPFVGTVLPARTSDVGSAVDGRIVDFPVNDGQFVREGQPIAALLRGLLEIEKAGAVAELERRKQVLGELQAGSRPEEVEQARALVAGFEARLEYARSRVARLGRLAERGTSTVDEVQDAQTELQAIAAQLRGGRAALALAEAGPREEQIAQAAAAAAVQEAEVERIDDQLGKHTIRAPFDGWVVQRFAEKGQWLSRGGLVARIAELGQVEVEARVPELSISGLKEGAAVRLEFDAAPGEIWIGNVIRVVPQADLLSRSFPVKIRVENRIVNGEPVLKGGMLARAWLPVGRTGPALVVPKDAVVLGGQQPFVYVVDSVADVSAAEETAGSGTATVRRVDVVLGAAIDGNVEVRGGLEPDAAVVVRGNERLRPGMTVRIQP